MLSAFLGLFLLRETSISSCFTILLSILNGNRIHKTYFEKYKCSANRGNIRMMIIVMSFSLAMVCGFVALSNLFIVCIYIYI